MEVSPGNEDFAYEGEQALTETGEGAVAKSFLSNFMVPGIQPQPSYPQQPQFGQYTNQQFVPLTSNEKKIRIASLAVEYGVPPRSDVKLRFVVGPRETNKPPGKGPGETDKFKRKWRNLLEFSRKHNWRGLIDMDFQGNYRDDSMTFIIDKVEWKTITHYMLGMLYINTPTYAILYSLESSKIQHGFWGDPRLAVQEHINNIRSGKYDIDYDYPEKVEGYLKRALLAKFSQNPVAREALLLTEDAVLSMRGGPTGIVDVPALMEIRTLLAKDPTMIYRGDTVPIEREEVVVSIAESAEQLNIGFLTADQRESMAADPTNRLIAGSVLQKSIFQPVSIESQKTNLNAMGISNIIVETEEILETECIIYAITGSKPVNFPNLLSIYGQPKFLRRNIYGMERMADDVKSGIMIAVQRKATSFQAEYIVFDVSLGGASTEYLVEKKSSRRTTVTTVKGPGGKGKRVMSKKVEDEKAPVIVPVKVAPVSFSLYLQPFTSGFGVFIVAPSLDVRILDFLKFVSGVSKGSAIQVVSPGSQDQTVTANDTQPVDLTSAQIIPHSQYIPQNQIQPSTSLVNLILNSPLDPNTVFWYNSKSSDAPTPGKGAKEQITAGREAEFQPLSTALGWRKMLSNFFVSPFKLDGLTWNTVEHYYQASKFKVGNPAAYQAFSLEANSFISQDPAVAKAAGGKSGMQGTTVIRPPNVVMDADFFAGRDKLEMFNAMFAKFSQNNYLKGVLLATGNAVLTHSTRGGDPKPVYELMKVRELLRN